MSNLMIFLSQNGFMMKYFDNKSATNPDRVQGSHMYKRSYNTGGSYYTTFGIYRFVLRHDLLMRIVLLNSKSLPKYLKTCDNVANI